MGRLVTFAITLVLVGALAAGSSAQPPASLAGAGGGSSFVFKGDQLVGAPVLVSFALSDDGTSANVYASFGERCGKSFYNGWVLANAPISRGGAINLRTHAQFVEGENVNPSVSLTAQLAPDGATGTIRYSARFKGRKCTHRSTPDFVAHPVTSETGTGSALASTEYRGLVSKPVRRVYAAPIVLLTSADGTRVVGAAWTAALSCKHKKGDWFDNYSPTAQIQPDGTFERNERFSQKFAGGGSIRYRTQFAGRIIGRVAEGSLRLREVIRRHGKVSDRCDSGLLHWSASP